MGQSNFAAARCRSVGSATNLGKRRARTGLYVLGATSTVVGFTTLPIAYLTGRTVESASGDVVFRAVLYAVFLAALVAPFVLLAWV